MSLRDKYSSFQFQTVKSNPSPELQQEIKRLLGSHLGKGKTRILAIASMIAGLVGVGFAAFVIITLYDKNVSITADDAAFHAWLETLTWYTGFGLLSFGV
ncbi:MAG: hypothetical protein ACTSXU_05295, partial [Promethearchaeota archaeon]